jgi:hypothetical protein
MYSFKELMNDADNLDLSNFDIESRNEGAPTGAPLAKIDILKGYRHVYGDVNVETLNIQPILMPRNIVMSRIEQLYDKQTELLLKKKTINGIDFVQTVCDNLKEKFNSNTLYSYQALSNLLYSVHKYSSHQEVKNFNFFLFHGEDSYKLLYYLYIRQFVKIIGHVNFIAHQKSDKDPYKIIVSYDKCVQIVRTIFFSDEDIFEKVFSHFKNVHKSRQPISYFALLNSIFEVDFPYKEIPMMDIMNSLYAQKKPDELKRMMLNFTPAVKKKLPETKSPEYHDGTDYFNPEADYNNLSEHLDDHEIHEDEEENKMTEAERVAQLEKNERELFQLVKSELVDFAKLYTVNFINDNDISHNVAKSKFEGISQQIYKKLYHLTAAIFLSNRKKFFKLMRTKEDNDQLLLKYWIDANELVKQLKHVSVSNPVIARDFLNTLTGSKSLQENLQFFLDFQLKSDIDTLASTRDIAAFE